MNILQLLSPSSADFDCHPFFEQGSDVNQVA
jgi:hypothetical protein